MNPTRLSALLLLALAGCPGRLEDPDKFRSCQLDVEKDILVAKCGLAGCHAAMSPQNGLDLVSAGVAGRLATSTSMCNGKSQKAFMAEKLTAAPACGSQMPLGEPLTTAEDACVREYLNGLGTSDGGS